MTKTTHCNNEFQAVWVVEFHHHDFSDLNGVFTTQQKASEYLLENVKRCDHWKEFTIDAVGDDNTWVVFKFICVTEKETLPVSVSIYQTELR